MDNLRIISINVVDSTTITAKFTHNLDTEIDVDNIAITAQLDNTPDPTVLKTDINLDTITLTTQPLTPLVAYFLIFKSTDVVPFKSLNGDAILFEDGVANQQIIIGPIESDNPVQEFLINYLRDNIYDKITDSTSVVNKIVQSLSLLLSKALYDIRQSKNENYLSFTVLDEQKTRSAGPFDRLNEEGAYEIIRVGKGITGSAATSNVVVSEFTESPISLLAVSFTEDFLPASKDDVKKFNINSFMLTASKHNVSKLKSVTFIYSDSRSPYVYDIDGYGYQILNGKYDQDFSFPYALLEDNQFKLSSNILADTKFSTENIIRASVTYEYRNLGRIINAESFTLTTVLSSVREVLPPIINVFNLKHGPVTDSSGNSIVTGGLTFTNLNANNILVPHGAFLRELSFKINALPAKPGEYCVDYSTGTVYVFGIDLSNDGTGPFPPLATYNYVLNYKDTIDYTFDTDSNDIVALPNGNLINNPGTISFNYEEALIPGVDFTVNLHKEDLNERIENRLLALNTIKVNNNPITNVFRIFNETSGEIYNVLRWSDNKIYFTYNNPPNIKTSLGERANFSEVLNEILFVNTTLTNGSSIKVFKCLLDNNNLISATEDCIGSFINTSASFSKIDLFVSEKWFDGYQSESSNINRLTVVGQYQIDYKNGIVYCAVTDPNNLDIGTIAYKKDSISPINSHVLSVDDIYYRLSSLQSKDKVFQYSNFGEGFINPKSLDVSDEAFLNGNVGAAYQIDNKQIGVFIDATFIPGTTNTIKFVRGLYEYTDLLNNIYPINFAEASVNTNTSIETNSIERQEFTSVLFDGTHYYVNLNLNLSYVSSNLTFNISIIRNSDSVDLWNPIGTIVAGAPVKLILSNTNSPTTSDTVVINYSITINDLSRVVVDYNKGDFFVDYTYLADEIIVSYEYGENLLDFRKTNSLSAGDQYYASYKVGALRDGLLKNFGTLVNIPELANFDINLDRERYRDSLSAALESFLQGPTKAALSNIANKISHNKPEITESVFQNWSLGASLLNPKSFETTGEFELVSGKYGNGVLIDTPGQTITLPATSNLKLEQGTFETWVFPEWNGIDNDADLTITLSKDGYVIPSNKIFIGSLEYHPTYDNNNYFTINKTSNVIGIPNFNKNGTFIYYDKDISGDFYRWYFNVIDGYADGYIGTPVSKSYTIEVSSSGNLYDVKSLTSPKPSTLKIISSTKSATFKINTTQGIHEAVTFIADRDHYILDFGEDKNKNRLSIFKDASGYLNFKIYDNKEQSYIVSSDISSWKANEKHFVAASWNINSKNFRDEMHLFVDGFETPNILRYGSKISPYLHERFRTINPEEIAGSIAKNIVGSIDLVTTAGSNQVSSSLDFNSFSINVSDTIFIDEAGFNTLGYTITNVNGNTLTLNTTMPLTLTDGKFSVNRASFTISTEIDIYPNIAVSTISAVHSGTDLVTTATLPTVSSAGSNFITLGIKAGDLIRIEHVNFVNHYAILSVSTHSLILNGNMPLTLSGQTFHLYKNSDVEIPGVRALRPAYSISQDGYYNNILTISNSAAANDLVLVKTLGLNHKRIKHKFYQWGSSSNVIQTYLPPPISLNTVKINHILLDNTLINSSNASLISNNFTSNSLTTAQPSTSDNGRTLAVKISSGNLNFGTSVIVTISGTINGSPGSEAVTFTEVESKNTTNKFSAVTGIVVTGLVVSTSKSFMTLQVQEAYSITKAENSTIVPDIKYSYKTRLGATLSGSGTTVTDGYGFFSSSDVNNYILITAPSGPAGTYQILNVSDDHLSATINTSLSPFTDGYYQIINATTFRSGFQNGLFLLEADGYPAQPYNLAQGLYEFDFYTYLNIDFAPINENMFFGTDYTGKNLLNGVLDEVKISGIKITDTRIGETIGTNQESITKDFNSLKKFKKNKNALVLATFDVFPFTNDTDFYITSENKKFIQAGFSVNDNFASSLYLTDKPVILDNSGILNTKTDGTIEFWVSPNFDTANDPNYRFYFDASGSIIENTVSSDNVSVRVPGKIGKVISVTIPGDSKNIDYFVGGRVELDSAGAISEVITSSSTNIVVTSNKIQQVISVKIVNDPTNLDYFTDGHVGVDKKTIYLGKDLPSNTLSVTVIYKTIDTNVLSPNTQVIKLNKRLPNQQTPVRVNYIPNGLQGDRVSIYKDPAGFLNFDIMANNIDYAVRAPIFWDKGSWHRIKAIYTMNGNKSKDTMRLFIDGYEHGNILFGTGLIFGQGAVYGSNYVGSATLKANIKFKDTVNELYIGSDFNGGNGAFALIDNLRISNIARPVFAPFGESLDINYNSNLDIALPVVTDLYTTLLLDFETLITKNTDFVTLANKKSGIFDFSINIFDSFDIINSNTRVKDVLEKLIKTLKPANSRVFIRYS